MAQVIVQNVSKHFGKLVAVADLSITVEDAEFVVLLGPTGVGKTTTLRLVAGLEKADAGSISIGGRDVTGEAIAGRDVAFVFQQYSLYPHNTVFENLAFPLRSPLRKESAADVDARVSEIARLLHMESKLRNKVTELSGGEMQRVAIGRALVRQPNVFLMDEPLSSLDAKLREELRAELKRIQVDLGATILYVTHDQVEAMTLADRIGVLCEGRLLQVGTPHEIYARPDSVYVAQRLGSPPINLLPVGALGANTPPSAAQIGVRPEDIVLGEGRVSGTIIQIEHLGAETVVVLEVNGQRIHALADVDLRHRTGEHVAVSTVPGRTLYFDREGRRVEE
ncbi:MAG: ABC transporter ATP-binding protein [Gammaproteobacteria bacterium]